LQESFGSQVSDIGDWPGIRSEAEGAGNRVGVSFVALPELATEAEGCCGSKDREGAGDWGVIIHTSG
jgi:hypothetical protein